MEYGLYKNLVKYANGSKKAQLVIKDVNIVSVQTGEIYKSDVAISDGFIVGIGNYDGDEVIDGSDKYVCPGLVDSHLHLESTLVTPKELIHEAAKSGTTTFIVDPHEAANVKGLLGIEYILDETAKVPADVYVMMPSCVPATGIDDNGVTLTADMMEKYYDNPRILGLGEVMDYVSVVGADENMHKKLDLYRNKVIDGHAPGLNEKNLNSYALAGIMTDHECVDYDYAMEEKRRGIHIHIRQGSAAKNLDAIVTGIVKNNICTDGFSFCTDDKHIEDIRCEGHISFNVRRAIELGLSPMEAIKMATWNAAQCYGLKNIGAISVGREANFIILKDLDSFDIEEVYFRGKNVKDYELLQTVCKDELKHTVCIDSYNKTQLVLPNDHKEKAVIGIIPGQIVTKKLYDVLPGEDYFEPNEIYKKIVVVERHHNTGKVGVGAIKGFGITNGAIASSVAHDSHNIIVIGDNDKDIDLAIQNIKDIQGGYSIVSEGQVVESLPLPVMGLMSDAGYENVHETLKSMIDKARQMGVSEDIDPFITLSFMALPVIPEIRMTPRGMFDVNEFKFI